MAILITGPLILLAVILVALSLLMIAVLVPLIYVANKYEAKASRPDEAKSASEQGF